MCSITFNKSSLTSSTTSFSSCSSSLSRCFSSLSEDLNVSSGSVKFRISFSQSKRSKEPFTLGAKFMTTFWHPTLFHPRWDHSGKGSKFLREPCQMPNYLGLWWLSNGYMSSLSHKAAPRRLPSEFVFCLVLLNLCRDFLKEETFVLELSNTTQFWLPLRVPFELLTTFVAHNLFGCPSVIS